MTDQILIVLHQPTSSPGRIGQLLSRRGFTLDIRRPVLGDPLPDTMAEHAGAVIFGGPMSANDTDEFVRREIDWIGVTLREEAPFLGVCLGAQMLIKHLGGEIRPHPDGCAEVGYYPLRPTPAGRALMEWPETVYQWHREGMDLPSGVELLAKGDLFENQAVRVGPAAFGVQFHAELTLAMLHRWTTRGAKRMELPGAQGRRAHFEGRGIYDPAILRWLGSFLDLWIACDPRQREEPRRAAAG
ncbi:glutamine amidotransferase [Lutibaculum baratangense]|uniref:Glutamine amidotransferase class-I n=1 Tax=Lutibaculum baratangense AMV1 TaxID=631454 RepID=V4RCP0_9HYPH|nr:Glutamine amidotransferase class-I [Lutibaculum baratangense AMV1]